MGKQNRTMAESNYISMAKTDTWKARTARVVIVGGGFGGLAAAKALRKAPVKVILIDRTNHHVFQPLLYQVATSVLAPSQISSPIRGILRKQKNTTVIMGEVTGVDKEQRCVFVNSADREHVPVHYDYLVLATGVRHSYFGHDEFEKFAPGLKNLADAVAIRNKVLQAFEQAEAEEDPQLHQDLLTFILVGGGPTGVEMAAAFAIFVRTTLSFGLPANRSNQSTYCPNRRRATGPRHLRAGSVGCGAEALGEARRRSSPGPRRRKNRRGRRCRRR